MKSPYWGQRLDLRGDTSELIMQLAFHIAVDYLMIHKKLKHFIILSLQCCCCVVVQCFMGNIQLLGLEDTYIGVVSVEGKFPQCDVDSKGWLADLMRARVTGLAAGNHTSLLPEVGWIAVRLL